MTDPQTIELIQLENIGQAEVIALRRMQCGFVVHQDGTEERLPSHCEWIRKPGEQPTFKPGSVLAKLKRETGRAIAEQRNQYWCERCGCPLASKTTIGFDSVTGQSHLYEKMRCPLKKW
ncbi:hypothetical protein [Marinobacterium stanieri]|uniref:hypothetical protein n=1 Tax=Marinobacterium stanieri TaxID=49186 RepID=UPI001112BF61|nr:hypothetical protein [Marinobacterium stanieri]